MKIVRGVLSLDPLPVLVTGADRSSPSVRGASITPVTYRRRGGRFRGDCWAEPAYYKNWKPGAQTQGSVGPKIGSQAGKNARPWRWRLPLTIGSHASAPVPWLWEARGHPSRSIGWFRGRHIPFRGHTHTEPPFPTRRTKYPVQGGGVILAYRGHCGGC